ncbi:MAG TPA: hypothetical protein PKH09_03270 [Parvularculaceae bacterium]|nr:hypothetical protein [Parvularculaceae bacterium]
MAEPRPYDFVSFDAPDAAPAPVARRFSADDLAAARAEGLAEGRRLAMESIAANEAAALARLGDRLDAAVAATAGDIAKARADLLALTRAFIEEFCASIAQARDIDAAEDMLRRLTQNSEDRRGAHLFIAARRFDRLAPRLNNLLAERRLGDFVMIESDPSLEPGECRLEWRGGELRRGRAEIEAAVAAVFDSHSHPETESQS